MKLYDQTESLRKRSAYEVSFHVMSVISLPLSSIFTISNEYQFEYQLFRLVSKRRLSVVKRLSETAMASPV